MVSQDLQNKSQVLEFFCLSREPQQTQQKQSNVTDVQHSTFQLLPMTQY